jgi:GT2 family glycosyltransferase
MLSLIIPARNSADLTALCLSSVAYTITALNIPAQILLIDNNSSPADGIQQVFSDFLAAHTHARVLRLTRDLHYTAAFAIGLQHSAYQNILFVSNDMMITPSYVATLLAVSALRDDYGIIRGTSAHTDALPEHTVVAPVPLSSYETILRFSEMMATVNGLKHGEDAVLTGDSVLIKRAVIDAIGVLDTRFYGYFGDIDYGLRAHLAGFKLVCAKGAWLHHEGAGYLKGQNRDDLSEPHRNRMKLVQEAYGRFRQKWDLSLPELYNDLGTLKLFGMAEQNAHKITLNCSLDPDVLQHVQYMTRFNPGTVSAS